MATDIPSKTRSLDPSLLMDNAACASQCRELLDDHPTRQAVLLNVYRPLWDEIERLQAEVLKLESHIVDVYNAQESARETAARHCPTCARTVTEGCDYVACPFPPARTNQGDSDCLMPGDRPTPETTSPRKLRIGDCVTVMQKAIVAGPYGDNEVIVQLRSGGSAIVPRSEVQLRDCDAHDKPPTQVKTNGEPT